MRGKLVFGVAMAALMLGAAPNALAQQQADPSGDAHTTATLTPGQQVSGEISPAGDKDWYRLHVEAGQRYAITLDGVEVNGETLDPFVSVYAADGTTQLGFNDDANGSLNSAYSYVPTQTGDVFVEARGYSEDVTGSYHLSVAQSTLPPDAVGNDRNTRARLQSDTPVNGSIDYPGDLDSFRVSVTRGHIYRFTLVGGDGDSQLHDPLLRLVDRSGTELASNDDSGDGLNSALDYVPQTSGDVFIEAHSYDDTSTGTYTLALKTENLPPDPAGNDAHTSASLTIGRGITADIGYPADQDWYRVRLEAGQSYRFMLNGNGGDRGLADPVLKIHDASGNQVAMDDDGGEGLNSYLEFTAPTTGNYFVEASSFDETATGGYTLNSARGDIPNNNTTDAVLSMEGDTRTATLSPAGDSDWFKVTLTAGQAFRVAVDGDGSANALDPLVVLHGPDGAEVARDDDSGPGLNALLEYQATAPGDYFVEVRGFADDAAGAYTLTLTPGEIGNSPDNADQLTAGDEGRSSVINQDGDADWFAITLVEGRPYRFNVVGADADGLADPMLTLYDSDGKPVASDDDGGTGNNSYLSFRSATGGTYYAAVSSAGDHGTGHYTITATDTDVPGTTSTDETLDAAAGDDRSSTIEMPGDLDAYRVELAADTRYTIAVTANGDHPLSAPVVTILDENGARVAATAGRTAGTVTFRPEHAGTFYVQASGRGAATGDYKVSIRH